MDKIVIEGGVPLQGEVSISGAKNAALPIIAATLLAPGVHQLSNVPPLADIRTTKRLLGLMGVQFEDGEPLVVDSSRLTGWMAPYETVKTMRAAVLVLGPLVARARQASVSLPGGCAIGARPIDQHLKGLEAMGVKITLNQGYVEAKAKRLHGADITLDLPTVTGTENLMMAATLAKGTTRIVNAAQEPEVTDLARFLTAMGADIEGIGTDVLTIHGVQGADPGLLYHHERPHRGRDLSRRRGHHPGPGHHHQRPGGRDELRCWKNSTRPGCGSAPRTTGSWWSRAGPSPAWTSRPGPTPASPRTCRPSTWPS